MWSRWVIALGFVVTAFSRGAVPPDWDRQTPASQDHIQPCSYTNLLPLWTQPLQITANPGFNSYTLQGMYGKKSILNQLDVVVPDSITVDYDSHLGRYVGGTSLSFSDTGCSFDYKLEIAVSPEHLYVREKYPYASEVDDGRCVLRGYDWNYQGLAYRPIGDTLGQIYANEAAATTDAKRRQEWSLLSAAAKGDLSTVQSLLAAGANVDARDSDGRTPFLLSLWNGNLEIAKAIVAKKADLSVVDFEKLDGLAYAFNPVVPSKDAVATLKFAIAANPTPDWVGRGLSVAPFHFPAYGLELLKLGPSQAKIDETLNDFAGDLSSSPLSGDLASLFQAVLPKATKEARGKLLVALAMTDPQDMIRQVVQYSTDLETKNDEGFNAMAVAIDNKHLDLASQLLNLGASPSSVVGNKVPLVVWAGMDISNYTAQLIQSLWQKGANLTAVDADGNNVADAVLSESTLAELISDYKTRTQSGQQTRTVDCGLLQSISYPLPYYVSTFQWLVSIGVRPNKTAAADYQFLPVGCQMLPSPSTPAPEVVSQYGDTADPYATGEVPILAPRTTDWPPYRY